MTIAHLHSSTETEGLGRDSPHIFSMDVFPVSVTSVGLLKKDCKLSNGRPSIANAVCFLPLERLSANLSGLHLPELEKFGYKNFLNLTHFSQNDILAYY